MAKPKNPTYDNPPLTEAIFEFFYECSNWSPAIPGLFYSIVGKNYPVITQAPNGFGLMIGNGGIQLEPGGNQLTQYRSEDGSSIIQLSRGMLTVNKLPKYSGWSDYRKSILDAINALNEVLDVTKVNRLGLKALNKIDIKSSTLSSFKKHYSIYPIFPKSLNHDWNSIQMNIEVPINEGNEVLAVAIGTLLKEPGFEAPTLLQLYSTRIKAADEVDVSEWIDQAHINIRTLFEDALSEECKEKF